MTDSENCSCEFEDELTNTNNCSEKCLCGETCECQNEQTRSEGCECETECSCSDQCNCETECSCSEECDCGENCSCSEENKCNSECNCAEEAESEESESEKPESKKAESEESTNETDFKNCEEMEVEDEPICNNAEHKDYLKDLLRLQAEFDNYRKRMSTVLADTRNDGFMDAIEQFLPALDSFKMATDMITDKNTLMGIKFIEKGILDTLSKMGVEEIDTTGKFNPELHQAVDTDDGEEYESGDIIKVASKGFTYKGKVIRYSQVIVKR